MPRAAASVSGAPAISSHRSVSPGSSSSPMPNGAADFVRDLALALHEDLMGSHEQLAMVSIVQRERAVKNPHSDQGRGCAEFAQMIACPFRPLPCGLATDGGGAP